MVMRIYFSHQAGFSLIELMIVIAIIAVLSAVAVPQYQDYMTRAKWTVNLTEVEQVKLAITDCLYAEGGQVNACDTSEKLGFGNALTTPSHANSINISSAASSIALAVIGNSSAANCRIDITASINNGAVAWAAANAANNGSTCTRRKTGVTAMMVN
jgi:type IV pilus assembly protein PilA